MVLSFPLIRTAMILASESGKEIQVYPRRSEFVLTSYLTVLISHRHISALSPVRTGLAESGIFTSENVQIHRFAPFVVVQPFWHVECIAVRVDAEMRFSYHE